MMADVAKRQLGMHDISLGTCFNNTLGVAFIAEEKRDKSLKRLCLLLTGGLAVSEYRSLLGLLLHVSFLAGMRRSATHGMFTPLSEGGALSLGPETLVAGPHLTSSILARAGEWRCAPSGAVMHARKARHTQESRASARVTTTHESGSGD